MMEDAINDETGRGSGSQLQREEQAAHPLDNLTYADEFRIARYLVLKHDNWSPSWLARTLDVQWNQAARWLERINRST